MMMMMMMMHLFCGWMDRRFTGADSLIPIMHDYDVYVVSLSMCLFILFHFILFYFMYFSYALAKRRMSLCRFALATI